MRKFSALVVLALAASAGLAQAAKQQSPTQTFTTRSGTSLTGDGIAAPALLPAQEATFTTDINLAGFTANGDFADPTNSRTTVSLLPSAFITGIEWINLNFDAINGSWRSEFVISTNQSSDTGAAGTFWDHRPSTAGSPGNYTGSGAFGNPSNQFSSGPFQLLPDGQLLVYVYDTFPDPGVDAVVNSGTLRVTYSDSAPPPPTPPASTPALAGGSITSTLTAGEVEWYSFSWAGGAITLDTEGSSLLPDNDTEIGLYDAATGALIASDDDTGTGNLSQLSGTLAAGNYLLAVAGFNTTFGGGFGATSTSTNVGTVVINGISVVPEPTSLAALALAGVIGRRRRA